MMKIEFKIANIMKYDDKYDIKTNVNIYTIF